MRAPLDLRRWAARHLRHSSLQKSFSARAVSRSHQRAEHILKNLQQEEEKRRLGREASIITAIPVAQEACYEPTCSPPPEQEEEGGAGISGKRLTGVGKLKMPQPHSRLFVVLHSHWLCWTFIPPAEEVVNLASRRLSVSPSCASSNSHRNYSFRRGSVWSMRSLASADGMNAAPCARCRNKSHFIHALTFNLFLLGQMTRTRRSTLPLTTCYSRPKPSSQHASVLQCCP